MIAQLSMLWVPWVEGLTGHLDGLVSWQAAMDYSLFRSESCAMVVESGMT